MATLTSIVAWSDDQLSTEVDGAAVLMSIAHGCYFGLDAIASDVWRRLEQPVRVADLCGALARDYDGTAEAIEQDVLNLLARLTEHGLIEVRE